VKIVYARLNIVQVQALRQDSARLWQLGWAPGLENAALLSLEQDPAALQALVREAAGEAAGDVDSPAALMSAALGGDCGDGDWRDNAIDLGHGAACLLSPVAVRNVAARLGRPQDRLAALSRLQGFYAQAAGQGQYVLVARAAPEPDVLNR
jgi:hypothetical protein